MSADLIFFNAQVYTVDEARPRAQAVAIQGNRIVYVGDDAGATAWQGAETKMVDGTGRSLLPGFIDSHYHLLWGSKLLPGPQLQEVESMPELIHAIKSWLAENPDADWIVGQGLSYGLPTVEIPLTRDYLDEIVSDRPLVLMAFDQHSMFVNSVALAQAGIRHGTRESMANGEIPVDEHGLATGELYEMDAMDFIHNALPQPDDEQLREIVKAGLAYSAALGITSIHNMDGEYEQAALYAKMEELGELTVRVYMPFWVKPEHDLKTMLEEANRMRTAFSSDKVRAGAVKFFMDGVYESHTAMSLNGYEDKPEARGEAIWSAETFASFAKAADKAGLQIAVHAVGDAAVKAVLDGYQAAHEENGPRDSRHRVEHIEVVDPEDIPRFKSLDVIASMQPLHAPISANDPDVWPLRVKPQDWPNAFVWRAFREAGVRLAFGSDWPVVTGDPILGLYGAVNRAPFRPGLADQQQSLEEALASYTKDGAYTEFKEAEKGMLKVGYLADLVLLSGDIFNTDKENLPDMSVAMTVCDGQIVYEAT